MLTQVVELAGASLPNRREHEAQDRFVCGQDVRGAWLIVADGVTGGHWGAEAAQIAVATCQRVLAAGQLGEYAVLNAMDLAHTAVRALFGDQTTGGTTLTIATISGGALVVAAAGDSPAYVQAGDQPLEQVTPVRRGALRDYVGMPGELQPWTGRFELGENTTVLVTSDGVAPLRLGEVPSGPAGWCVAVLDETRNDDDATIVAARIRIAPQHSRQTTDAAVVAAVAMSVAVSPDARMSTDTLHELYQPPSPPDRPDADSPLTRHAPIGDDLEGPAVTDTSFTEPASRNRWLHGRKRR